MRIIYDLTLTLACKPRGSQLCITRRSQRQAVTCSAGAGPRWSASGSPAACGRRRPSHAGRKLRHRGVIAAGDDARVPAALSPAERGSDPFQRRSGTERRGGDTRAVHFSLVRRDRRVRAAGTETTCRISGVFGGRPDVVARPDRCRAAARQDHRPGCVAQAGAAHLAHMHRGLAEGAAQPLPKGQHAVKCIHGSAPRDVPAAGHGERQRCLADCWAPGARAISRSSCAASAPARL